MTAVEWLFNEVKKVKIIDEHEEDLYYQAIEMGKQQMEISDKEIEKASITADLDYEFIRGAKWYREKLKQKL